jgi:hypothetical protein
MAISTFSKTMTTMKEKKQIKMRLKAVGKSSLSKPPKSPRRIV